MDVFLACPHDSEFAIHTAFSFIATDPETPPRSPREDGVHEQSPVSGFMARCQAASGWLTARFKLCLGQTLFPGHRLACAAIYRHVTLRVSGIASCFAVNEILAVCRISCIS